MAEEIAQRARKTLYCMICGLQTVSNFVGHAIPDSWLDDVVLLRDPDDEIGSISPSLTHTNLLKRTEVYQAEAQIEGFRPRSEASPIEVASAHPGAEPAFYYKRQESGKIVCLVFSKDQHPTRYRNLSNEHHLPVHRSCLKLAERLWTLSPDTAYVKDLRGLFLGLAWRYALGVKSYGMLSYSFPPNYRLADDFHLKWVVWKKTEKAQGEATKDDTATARDPLQSDEYFWGPDPAGLMEVTSFVCKNLEQTPRRRPSKFETRLYELPPELRASIFDSFAFRDWPQLTTGLLPQSFWLKQLKSGRALPWLFELEVESHLLDEKAAQPCPGGDGFEWNWELLFRKLTRGVNFGVLPTTPTGKDPYTPIRGGPDGSLVIQSEETFWGFEGYHEDLKDVPAGILNRRRTWQLLEEMFVGDYLPQINTAATSVRAIAPLWVREHCIQLPWDKSGKLLKTPKWLPSVDFKPYVRLLNGEFDIRTDTLAPLQYWQDPGGYWRRVGLRHFDHYSDHDGWSVLPPKSATPEEVFLVLRGLGYPV